MTLKFYCPGQPDTATIATQYSKLRRQLPPVATTPRSSP